MDNTARDEDSAIVKLKARLYDAQVESAQLGISLNNSNKQLKETKTLLSRAMAHMETETARLYDAQCENVALRSENAELKMALESTTMQLKEAKALLDRAMKHIQKGKEPEKTAEVPLILAASESRQPRQELPIRVTLEDQRAVGLESWRKAVPSGSPPPTPQKELDIPRRSLISKASKIRDHNLTQEEQTGLVAKPEPQRYYDWMAIMFVEKPDGEVSQADIWNLYREAFTPFGHQYPLLVAAQVINRIQDVFPQARTEVIEDPLKRYVVCGLARRKDYR